MKVTKLCCDDCKNGVLLALYTEMVPYTASGGSKNHHYFFLWGIWEVRRDSGSVVILSLYSEPRNPASYTGREREWASWASYNCHDKTINPLKFIGSWSNALHIAFRDIHPLAFKDLFTTIKETHCIYEA